jgi:hypothetical protein
VVVVVVVAAAYLAWLEVGWDIIDCLETWWWDGVRMGMMMDVGRRKEDRGGKGVNGEAEGKGMREGMQIEL